MDILTAEDREKGFVRPLRMTYVHDPCRSEATLCPAAAEAFAKNPRCCSSAFCTVCGQQRPLSQFVWKGTNERLGS